jgi:hypothetical protein
MKTVWATLAILAALAALVSAITIPSRTEAVFSHTSTSGASASADGVDHWLHIYTASSDPDTPLPAYDTQAPDNEVYSATGLDDSTTVNLGTYRGNTKEFVYCVFTMKAPPVFPDPTIAQVRATASLQPNAVRPIDGIAIAPLNSHSMTYNYADLAANAKVQLNLHIKTTGVAHGTYSRTAQIVVTFTGLSSAYYVYNIPLTITIA